MEIAKVQVSGCRCEVTRLEPIPKGIVGGVVSIEYTDSAWDNLRKTVVFRGAATKDVLNAGKEAVIPAEVVARAGVQLYMGVYGVDADGAVVIPTIWASLGMVRGAAAPSGDCSTDPSLPVWAQIQGMIGNLNELDTTAKSSLVAAVNEAFVSGGGSVSPGAVQKIVDDYLKANPPAAGKDGADGITPTIGSNGNWYLGTVDTGKPSRGESVNSRPFVVTVTYTSVTAYAADKTFQEILDAYNDGAQVNARVIGYPGVVAPSTLPLFVYTGQQFLFSGAGIASSAITMTARCFEDGRWEVTLMALAAGKDEWELIKAITIPEDAEESNALTINQDENGNAFRLKKAKLFAAFPKYTGASSIPGYSFAMLNGKNAGGSGVMNPLGYTSAWNVPNASGERGTVWEIDTSGPFYMERCIRVNNAGVQPNSGSGVRIGSNNTYETPYYRLSDFDIMKPITSIGGTKMLIYPGCQFWLYGVRE